MRVHLRVFAALRLCENQHLRPNSATLRELSPPTKLCVFARNNYSTKLSACTSVPLRELSHPTNLGVLASLRELSHSTKQIASPRNKKINALPTNLTLFLLQLQQEPIMVKRFSSNPTLKVLRFQFHLYVHQKLIRHVLAKAFLTLNSLI